jgi:hypothetical protein
LSSFGEHTLPEKTLAFNSFETHPNDMRPVQVNHYLAEVLVRFVDQLETGALVSVSEGGIRVRSLPVKGRTDEHP